VRGWKGFAVLYLAFLLCESLPLSIHTSYTYLPLDSTAAMSTAYRPSTHALFSIMAHANPQTRCRSWQARPGRFHTSSGVYVSRCRYKRKMTGFKKSIAPHALPSTLCGSSRWHGRMGFYQPCGRSLDPRCFNTLPSRCPRLSSDVPAGSCSAFCNENRRFYRHLVRHGFASSAARRYLLV
jgi:hypothetical protein